MVAIERFGRIALDLLDPYEERNRQIEWFAADCLPLLADLMAG